MKIAITVPDEIFDRAERAASRHGMNRSQFYAAAAERYVAELESDALAAAIDATNTDASTRFAVTASGRSLDGSNDDW